MRRLRAHPTRRRKRLLQQRQIESFEQPQRQQRLDHEAAGKSIEAEQRGQLVDDMARRPERGSGPLLRTRPASWNASVDEAAEQSKARIQYKHDPERGELAEAKRRHQLRESRREGASRSRQRPDQAVAGKNPCAIGIVGFVRQHRMLQRHEHADAPCRRIGRARKRHDEEDGVIVDGGERHAGGRHQSGGGQQQPAVVVSGAKKTGCNRQQCGAEQRRCRHDSHLKRPQSKTQQIDRQQYGNEAIAEIAQRPRPQQTIDGDRGPIGRFKRTHATPLASRARLVAELGREASWENGESANVPTLVRLSEPGLASQAAGPVSSRPLSFPGICGTLAAWNTRTASGSATRIAGLRISAGWSSAIRALRSIRWPAPSITTS